MALKALERSRQVQEEAATRKISSPGDLKKYWYELCDPCVPEERKESFRDRLDAEFLLHWRRNEALMRSLRETDDSYVVLGIMVGGFRRASRIHDLLEGEGKAVGFALAGYSSGLHSVPHEGSNYDLGKVHIPVPYRELLRECRKEKVLIVDDFCVTGETVAAVASLLRAEGAGDLYFNCLHYQTPNGHLNDDPEHISALCSKVGVRWLP